MGSTVDESGILFNQAFWLGKLQFTQMDEKTDN